MTESARYVKIVGWSETDGAFVGQCPGLIGPCCHGPDEAVVYRELCSLVEEWLIDCFGIVAHSPRHDGSSPRGNDRLTRSCQGHHFGGSIATITIHSTPKRSTSCP